MENSCLVWTNFPFTQPSSQLYRPRSFRGTFSNQYGGGDEESTHPAIGLYNVFTCEYTRFYHLTAVEQEIQREKQNFGVL